MSTGGERKSGPARDVELAERIRRRLVERALDAYEDARMQGLCAEGAFEAAVSALRTLDVGELVEAAHGER